MITAFYWKELFPIKGASTKKKPPQMGGFLLWSETRLGNEVLCD